MSADLIEIIEKALPTMSKGQKRIASYITEHCEKAAYLTASGLGEQSGGRIHRCPLCHRAWL